MYADLSGASGTSCASWCTRPGKHEILHWLQTCISNWTAARMSDSCRGYLLPQAAKAAMVSLGSF